MNIEDVLKSFEKTFGCRVSFHDYYRELCSKFLIRKYINHFNPFCNAVKDGKGNLKRCEMFDSVEIQAKAMDVMGPFFKICHVGALELVVPVIVRGRIRGLLFAGQFTAKSDFNTDLEILSKAKIFSGKGLPVLGKNETKPLIDFACLIADYMGKVLDDNGPLLMEGGALDKKITFYFEKEFSSKTISINTLSEFLGLGRSRTSQLLKKYFNKSFPEMLAERRIEHARYLLTHTLLTISVIANECGFSDPAYFFKVFRIHNKNQSPGNFRKQNWQCENKNI